MSEFEKLFNDLRNMREERSSFDLKTIWDGIAQRKDFSAMGFKTLEEFEKFISDNPYLNI